MNTGKYDNQQKAEEFVRRVIGNKADYYDDIASKNRRIKRRNKIKSLKK